MKKVNRMLAFILAAALVCTNALPAFADGEGADSQPTPPPTEISESAPDPAPPAEAPAPEPDPEPAPEADPIPEPDPEPVPEADPEPDPEPEQQPEPEPQPVPDPVPAPQPTEAPAATPVPTPTPQPETLPAVSYGFGMMEEPGIEGNDILQLVFQLTVDGETQAPIAVQINPAMKGGPVTLTGEARAKVEELLAAGYELTWYKDAGHSVKVDKLEDLTVTGEANQRIYGAAVKPAGEDALEPEPTPEPPQNAGGTASLSDGDVVFEITYAPMSSSVADGLAKTFQVNLLVGDSSDPTKGTFATKDTFSTVACGINSFSFSARSDASNYKLTRIELLGATSAPKMNLPDGSQISGDGGESRFIYDYTGAGVNFSMKQTFIGWDFAGNPATMNIYLTKEVVEEPGLHVSYEVADAPEGGYIVNDYAQFNIKVTNTGTTTLKNIIVTEVEHPNRFYLTGTAGYSHPDQHTAKIPVLEPGRTVTIKAQMLIGRTDMINDGVSNTVTVTADDGVVPDDESRLTVDVPLHKTIYNVYLDYVNNSSGVIFNSFAPKFAYAGETYKINENNDMYDTYYDKFNQHSYVKVGYEGVLAGTMGKEDVHIKVFYELDDLGGTQWTGDKIPDKYQGTVTYALAGGAAGSNPQEQAITFKKGEAWSEDADATATVKLRPAPYREGYRFTGWSDGKGHIYAPGATVEIKKSDGNMTLTARWVAEGESGGGSGVNVETVTRTEMSLDTNGHPELDDVQVSLGGGIDALAQQMKENYSAEDLKKMLGSGAAGLDEVYIHVVTTVDMTVKDYSAEQMVLDITPHYTVYASASSTEITGDSTVLQDKTPLTSAEDTRGTVITIPIPAAFAANGDLIRVTHEHGSQTHYYTLPVKNGKITFTNNNGFSTFTLTRLTKAELDSLAVSGGSLSPAFAPDGTSYSVNVDSGTGSVTFTFTAADGSTITVNGTEATPNEDGTYTATVSGLATGSNNVTITVSGSGLASTTYTVTVNRAAPAPAGSTNTSNTSGNGNQTEEEDEDEDDSVNEAAAPAAPTAAPAAPAAAAPARRTPGTVYTAGTAGQQAPAQAAGTDDDTDANGGVDIGEDDTPLAAGPALESGEEPEGGQPEDSVDISEDETPLAPAPAQSARHRNLLPLLLIPAGLGFFFLLILLWRRKREEEEEEQAGQK